MLTVNLVHNVDDDDDKSDQSVVAPFYPLNKLANWWLVVGDAVSRQLVVIKKVTILKSLAVKLEFSLPMGTHHLKLWCIYRRLALEPIQVAEGEDSDSDEDMDSDDDE